jgi:hypothetical protein
MNIYTWREPSAQPETKVLLQTKTVLTSWLVVRPITNLMPVLMSMDY